MGRPKKSPLDIMLVRDLIEENQEKILENGQIISRKSEVWKQLSAALNGKWTALALYTMVHKNYYNLQDLIGVKENCAVKEEINDFTSSSLFSDGDDSNASTSSDNSIKSDSSNSSEEKIEFLILISWKDYKEIEPCEKTYHRKKEKACPTRILEERKYKIFKPGNWSSLLYKKIDAELGRRNIPCTYIFKRNKIYGETAVHFSVIAGKCKECGSQIKCTINQSPQENQEIPLRVELFQSNISGICHQNKIRAITGKERKEIGETLTQTNTAPSQFRRTLAANNESEIDRIPRLSTIRQIKHESVKEKLLDNDPVAAIWKMKFDPSMQGAIQNIGLDPFFVYFWTNNQVHVYNKFCQTQYAKISIDATGNVVYKIKKPCGEKSKHIFLYDITVRSTNKRGGDNQFSVSSMLSESQNAVSIYSWLANWMRIGASKPQEVVTDMSLALIYACIMAFSNSKSLKEYITKCYKTLFENEPLKEICYIRNDVAHFIKLVSQWSSLRKQHKLTKQLYLRAVGQLIQCTDITHMENIFQAIFTVAYSDTEGVNAYGEETICEMRKKWLIKLCATGLTETIESILEMNSNDLNDIKNFKMDVRDDSKNEFEVWVKNIAESCKCIVNKADQVGDRGNQQYLPEIVDDILNSCKLLPLWSAIMAKYFPSSPTIGSSAPVESNFNNIKNRVFANKNLPIRIDKFTQILVKSNDGQAKLSTRKLDEELYELCNFERVRMRSSHSPICLLFKELFIPITQSVFLCWSCFNL